MTEQQMMERIKELEEENKKLKSTRVAPNIKGAMRNQKELDFVYPYYSEHDSKWRRSTVETGFTNLRKLALNSVNQVGSNNKFVEQKVKNLSAEDFLIAVQCADELVEVVAKYKKLYLQSVGREDIIKAFDM